MPTLAADDVLATLTKLTAVTVADACRAHGVTSLVVSGGGTRNSILMRMIVEELPGLAPLRLPEPAARPPRLLRITGPAG